MRVFLSCAILSLVAAPLHAETYKWVDEKGVTNYSSAPPPAKATKTKVVEDRISVIPSDPTLAEAAAWLREREARRDAEWLERQRAIHAAQANAYAIPAYQDCPYRADCGYYDGYAYAYYPAYFARYPAHHPAHRYARAKLASRILAHPVPVPRGRMTGVRSQRASLR